MEAQRMAAVAREGKTLSGAMRAILVVASLLVVSVGISLFFLTEHTDRYFAWTIGAPVTAAFLGAGYLASFVLELRSARQDTWDKARLAVPAVLLFTLLTLVATLLHLDAFHFDAPRLITRAGTWVWLVVYAGVPPALALIWYLQVRGPGSDPPRQARLPAPMRWVLGLQGALMLLAGAVLFVAPEAADAWWPWELTALTGRAIGAWLLGVGTAAAHAAGENDWARAESMLQTYWVFAALQFIALARYPEAVAWGAPAAWVYVAFMLTVLAAGLAGWITAVRVKRARVS